MRRMSVASLPWWVGAAFVLQAVVVYFVARLVNRRHTRAVILELANKVAQLESEHQSLIAAAKAVQAKFDDQFERISGYLRERDEWQTLYYTSASEHGTAQAMMLAERQRLIHQLRRVGIDPKSSPVLEAVANAFDETHAGPARAALKARADGTKMGDEQERDDP
jgi:hypothetical protein